MTVNESIIKKAGELILSGEIGIERENLRVTGNGEFSSVPDPFSEEKYITRDFCENQTELNAPPAGTVEEAHRLFNDYTRNMMKVLKSLAEPEYLWPFSNPPFIEDENLIVPACFTCDKLQESEYRKYLAEKYGKKLMTFSGIHINYSLSEEMFVYLCEHESVADINSLKNRLYLNMAYNASEYGWIVSALTAASPLSDESFFRRTMKPETVFNGKASLRCSENGYWNLFNPILDYSDIEKYALCIQNYIDEGLIFRASELYYPVRIKSSGQYSPENLVKCGANHIEFRMVDLNPFEPTGLSIYDLAFIKYFLVWACFLPVYTDDALYSSEHLVDNYKRTSVFDFENAMIINKYGMEIQAVSAGLDILDNMLAFYNHLSSDITDNINNMKKRLLNPSGRYSVRIMNMAENDFGLSGLKIARGNIKKLGL